MRFWLVTALALSGCNDPCYLGTCKQQFKFHEACEGELGLSPLTCIDGPEDDWFDAEGRLTDEGSAGMSAQSRPCDGRRDYVRSCKMTRRAINKAVEDDQAREETCEEQIDQHDELEKALRKKDCDEWQRLLSD